MKRYYSFAGLDFQIDMPYEKWDVEERSLAPFRVEKVKEPHRFDFSIVDFLPPASGVCIALEPAFAVYQDDDWTVRYIGTVQNGLDHAYIRVAHRGKEHNVLLKAGSFLDRIGSKTVLNSLSAEHLVAQNCGFVFHSSYVEYGGKAILFTAPSGTGKSTQADLWQKHRGAVIVNGDRSVIRQADAGIVACGIPFAGSSQICLNKTLPLGAVVYLKQAPQNRIRRLVGAEGFCRIWEGCSVNTWDKADVAAVSETVQRVLGSVPIFELACTPDEVAVNTLEEELKQEGIL